MDFSEAIRAQIRGQTVRRARLVWFDFVSQPLGLWNGVGNLTTKDGRRWLGLAGLGRVEGVRQAIDGAAPEMRFIVSGTEKQGVDGSFIAKVRGEAAEYFNRSVTVFSQFFTGDDAEEGPWQNLDLPFAESWGLMQSMTAKKESTEEGFVRTVTISAETPFVGRKRPRFSYLTDTDQKQRFPGDRGAENVAGIEQILIRFP